MSTETLADLIMLVIGIILFAGIILLFVKGFKSRRSGSITTLAGATSEMMTEDKKRAMEILVKTKAKKKMEEQETGEPKDKLKTD